MIGAASSNEQVDITQAAEAPAGPRCNLLFSALAKRPHPQPMILRPRPPRQGTLRLTLRGARADQAMQIDRNTGGLRCRHQVEPELRSGSDGTP
jgi:hypothetical protein